MPLEECFGLSLVLHVRHKMAGYFPTIADLQAALADPCLRINLRRVAENPTTIRAEAEKKARSTTVTSCM
jgi:hypothetical protein